MSRKKNAQSTDPALPAIPPELLEHLVSGPMSAESLEAMFRALKKAVIERAMNAELTHHLGYAPGEARPEAQANHRNGTSEKTILTDAGELTLALPRDRQGSFEPQLIPKHQRRFSGFDEKIIALYARGLTVREIQKHLLELYAVEVSPQLVSEVTEAVIDEVKLWQHRPLEPVYPVVFLDALRVKIRDEGVVRNKAVYLALGVLPDGRRDILGLWIEQTEGAKFWLRVVTELKNRGVEDILIAVVDGLKGFGEAIEAVFPQTTVQTCIVHLIRNSLEYVSWKERKKVASALRAIYTAPTLEAAEAALDAFEAGPFGEKHPLIGASWRRNWERVIPFFAFPKEVRRVIYTTNAIESLNMRLRKIIKTRGHFPSDEAATKLLYLALRNITEDWSKSIFDWRAAMSQFAILYGERLNPRSAELNP